MAAPIVYRWDDGNAPVARAERRSLHDILYACLVTGYGTKPGAGWTRPYVNATFDISAFRNNPATGTGFYLRVNSSSPPYFSKSWLTAYETMTEYSSGLSPFNSAIVEVCTGPTYASVADTTARPWVLIADDRAFYFVCWPDLTAAPAKTNTNASATFFGDLVRQSAADAYCCALCGAPDAYGSYGALNAPSTVLGSGNSGFYMPRKANGALGAVIAAMIRGGGPCDDTNCGVNGAPYVNGGPIYLSRPYINNTEAYSFRAYVPGFYCPCHPKPFGQLETVTVDDKSYLNFSHFVNYSSGNGAYLISLNDWRV